MFKKIFKISMLFFLGGIVGLGIWAKPIYAQSEEDLKSLLNDPYIKAALQEAYESGELKDTDLKELKEAVITQDPSDVTEREGSSEAYSWETEEGKKTALKAAQEAGLSKEGLKELEGLLESGVHDPEIMKEIFVKEGLVREDTSWDKENLKEGDWENLDPEKAKELFEKYEQEGPSGFDQFLRETIGHEMGEREEWIKEYGEHGFGGPSPEGDFDLSDRPQELEGVDFHFEPNQDFDRMLQDLEDKYSEDKLFDYPKEYSHDTEAYKEKEYEDKDYDLKDFFKEIEVEHDKERAEMEHETIEHYKEEMEKTLQEIPEAQREAVREVMEKEYEAAKEVMEREYQPLERDTEQRETSIEMEHALEREAPAAVEHENTEREVVQIEHERPEIEIQEREHMEFERPEYEHEYERMMEHEMEYEHPPVPGQ